MRYNILMKDIGFTKALLYRLEDDKGNMVAEAQFQLIDAVIQQLYGK